MEQKNEIGQIIKSVEASQLGWKPGYWAYRFEYQGEEFYQQSMVYAPDGDCGGMVYVNRDFSVKLTVWND